VTTTSVKLSPENTSPSRKVILGRYLGGRNVPVILVTQANFDSVYQLADDSTPTLAAGTYVRLVNAEMITGLLNPVFVVVLTPVVVWFFAMLAARGREISTARKIFYGMVITMISILIVAFGAYVGQDGAIKTSMMWLVIYYLVITTGELCLSPMGLSLVTKLSPKRLVGLMMGGWFVATSVGNKLAGFISGLEPSTMMFVVLAAAILGVAGFIYLLLPRLDAAIKQYGA
jgi:dipeptide/tripeptide permease